MTTRYSALYRKKHPGLQTRLARALAKGRERAPKTPLVFFRADDIGVPSGNFTRLIASFQQYRLPLCLAAVPSWTTAKRQRELLGLTGSDSSQWCWHQHGRLHRNFEQSGKKQEFGPARNRKELFHHLDKGKTRLEDLFGDSFLPVFTPPWNRCSGETMQALIELGFKAISRNRNASPAAPAALPDFQVSVDLHTRKESSPSQGLENLLQEFEQGLGTGRCGIMLHHQRMNETAFELLDMLLALIQNNRTLMPVHFGDLVN